MTSYEKTALTIWISKGISILSKAVSLPILLSSLKIDEYAALVILMGLESWFLLLDCGLGLSVQNFLSETTCSKEKKAYLKTTLVFGSAALLLGLIFLLSFSSYLAPFFFEGCHLKYPEETFFTGGIFLLLGMFGSLGGRIWLGQQKVFFFYLIQAVSSLLFFVLLVLFQSKIELKSSLFLVLGTPNVTSFCLTLFLFKKVDWKIPFNFKLLKRAKGFAVFSSMAAFVLSVDSLIIPKLLNSSEIVQYHIISKLFTPISFTYSSWLQGLWPACTLLWASHQGEEIRRKMVKYSWIGVMTTLFFTGALLFSSTFIESFLQVTLPCVGIVWGGLYVSSRIVGDFHAMALQSRSDLKPFFYLVPVQALISVSAQYFFASRFGMTGIFAGITLSYVVTVCWALPFRLRRIKQKVYVS